MPDREKVIKGVTKAIQIEKSNGKALVYLRVIDAKDILALLKEQEAVVRCKDCKYFSVIKWTEFHRRIWPEDGPECYSCLNPRCNCEEVLPTRGPDWYCADGEKRVST